MEINGSHQCTASSQLPNPSSSFLLFFSFLYPPFLLSSRLSHLPFGTYVVVSVFTPSCILVTHSSLSPDQETLGEGATGTAYS